MVHTAQLGNWREKSMEEEEVGEGMKARMGYKMGEVEFSCFLEIYFFMCKFLTGENLCYSIIMK